MTRKVIPGHDFIIISSIAAYCMVSRATVRRWIERGDLRATTLPSGHSRVNVADFTDFLTRHRIPVPRELLDLSPGEPERN